MDGDYVRQPMLTYCGNKRALVEWINDSVVEVKTALGVDKIRILDAFSGTGVVSRSLAEHASVLHSNDFEHFAYLQAKCFLGRPTDEQKSRVLAHIEAANALADTGPLVEGVLTKNYAPRNSDDIKAGERCFYTRENAMRFDTVRRYIADHVSENDTPFVLAPLIVQCSISANTSGVFNAFFKENGVGKWGGRSATVASSKRITAPRPLVPPIFNPYPCEVFCYCRDVNALMEEIPDVDLVYLDAPYNELSYGSNYFLLNTVAHNKLSDKITPGSGISVDWQRSAYYRKRTALKAFEDLMTKVMAKTKYAIIAYSNEGHVTQTEFEALLAPYAFTVVEREHARFSNTGHKGAARDNLKRPRTVCERMYLVSKK